MEEMLKAIIERLDKIEENQAKLFEKLENIEDWEDTNAQMEDEWRKSVDTDFAMISAEHDIIMHALADVSPTMQAMLDTSNECPKIKARAVKCSG